MQASRNEGLNGPVPPRALLDMGLRVMDSTPQAIARSYAPAMTPWATKCIACWEDPHWRSTLVAGTCHGSPAAIQALRVTLQACSPAWVTHPPTTSSIWPGSTSRRSSSDRSVRPSRSEWDAIRPARPCASPTGVRTVSTITASRLGMASHPRGVGTAYAAAAMRIATVVKAVAALDPVSARPGRPSPRPTPRAPTRSVAAPSRRRVSWPPRLATARSPCSHAGAAGATGTVHDAMSIARATGVPCDGILLRHPAVDRPDTLTTARALADAMTRAGGFDLVLAGLAALGDGTGQVGPQLAELLGLPFAAGARYREPGRGPAAGARRTTTTAGRSSTSTCPPSCPPRSDSSTPARPRPTRRTSS